MTLFTTGPDGMTGNDDLGTMSAWYVFSSLGLYPTMSGANFLAVSSPQFPSAVVSVGGHRLTITAPGASDDNRYIQRVKVNGRGLSRNWIPWSAIGSGGTIAHTLGPAPSSWGTAPADQPPSVDQAPADGRTHLDASVRPASAAVAPGGSVTLTVDLVGQSPGVLHPHVTATAPDGWTVAVRQPRPIVSHRLPTAGSATLTVTAPAGAALGAYPLSVTVTGAKPVVTTASLVVSKPLTCAFESSGQCAVDLGGEFTRDGTATVDAPSEGNFDGVGWSYDAALLPAAGPVTWDGVAYSAPSAAGTAVNFVPADGQALLLPPRSSAGSLHLIVTSHNGPVSGGLTIGYSDGSSTDVPLTVADWCGGATPGTSVALAMDHRIKAGQGIDGPPVSLFSVTIPVGANVRSLTLPTQPNLFVYALTLVHPAV